MHKFYEAYNSFALSLKNKNNKLKLNEITEDCQTSAKKPWIVLERIYESNTSAFSDVHYEHYFDESKNKTSIVVVTCLKHHKWFQCTSYNSISVK